MTQGERRIVLAEHAGYCFGVKQALETAEAVLREAKGKVYACGHLIHNEAVMEELAGKGLIFIDAPEEAEEGAALIVRSHGEAPEFYEKRDPRILRSLTRPAPL
jgi:4-hydroxy-3-methylbut-2-enyl diphosphate reductase